MSAHPRDCRRTCDKCGVLAEHRYAWTQVLAPDIAGSAGPDMVELVTHTCQACHSSYVTDRRDRPDLDGESHGWVTDRREPRAPKPCERETVRPGAVHAA